MEMFVMHWALTLERTVHNRPMGNYEKEALSTDWKLITGGVPSDWSPECLVTEWRS